MKGKQQQQQQQHRTNKPSAMIAVNLLFTNVNVSCFPSKIIMTHTNYTLRILNEPCVRRLLWHTSEQPHTTKSIRNLFEQCNILFSFMV